MRRSDRRLLILLAGLAVLCGTAAQAGDAAGGLLHLGPVLLVLVPLLCGRFPGERHVLRLAASRTRRPRRSPAPPLSPAGGRPRVAIPRSRLLGASLAVRPPPALRTA